MSQVSATNLDPESLGEVCEHVVTAVEAEGRGPDIEQAAVVEAENDHDGDIESVKHAPHLEGQPALDALKAERDHDGRKEADGHEARDADRGPEDAVLAQRDADDVAHGVQERKDEELHAEGRVQLVRAVQVQELREVPDQWHRQAHTPTSCKQAPLPSVLTVIRKALHLRLLNEAPESRALGEEDDDDQWVHEESSGLGHEEQADLNETL
jgi:hypothetical protein